MVMKQTSWRRYSKISPGCWTCVWTASLHCCGVCATASCSRTQADEVDRGRERRQSSWLCSLTSNPLLSALCCTRTEWHTHARTHARTHKKLCELFTCLGRVDMEGGGRTLHHNSHHAHQEASPRQLKCCLDPAIVLISDSPGHTKL